MRAGRTSREVSTAFYSVEVYPQVVNRIGGRNKVEVQSDCGAWSSPKREVNQRAFLGVNLDPPSAKPVFEGVKMLLEHQNDCKKWFIAHQPSWKIHNSDLYSKLFITLIIELISGFKFWNITRLWNPKRENNPPSPLSKVGNYWRWPNGRNRSYNKKFPVELAHY